MFNTGGSRIPLSAAQRGIWLAHESDGSGILHNFAGYVEVRGGLEATALTAAARSAVSETDALRVRFVLDEDGIPWQQLDGDTEYGALRIIDLGDRRKPMESALEWMRADLATPVDLIAGPLFAQALLRIAPDHSLLYLRYHHIVMDGYGQVVYWRRLAEFYSARRAGRAARPRIASTLGELLSDERLYQSSEQFAQDRAHWLDIAAGQDGPFTLTDDRSRAAVAAGLRTEPLRPLAGVGELAVRHRVHWSAAALAVVAAYLHRVTQHEDIVVGVPVRGRANRAALTTPGMFANVLPLRLSISASMGFDELVVQVSERLGQLLEHQRFRGEDLAAELRSTGDFAEQPGVLVNLVTFDGTIGFAGLAGAVHQLPSGPVRDLLIEFFGGTDGSEARFAIDGNPALHSRDELACHAGRLAAFLTEISRAPADSSVGSIELLTPEERTLLFGGTLLRRRDYDLSAPLPDLIERQARRTPDSVAVETARATLTYRELWEHSGSLAAHLRTRGIAPGQVVGIHQERSVDLVVALLAVLRSGAAYLPLDLDHPPARLAFQIEDSGAAMVLSRSDLTGGLPELAIPVVAVDDTLDGLPPAEVPQNLATPDDIAYIIYTSGSTGRPKGVAVPHRGVVNRLLWMQEEYRLGAEDKVLQKTAFTFDVSVWELFWPLLNGAVLHLGAPGVHRDPRALAEAIRGHDITTVHFVPSMLDLFLAESAARELPTLRRVICSGEALRPETVRRFFEVYGDGPELHNLYGPTEASIDVTHWRCGPRDAEGPVPIGRAVANTELYIVDHAGRSMPPGIPGELCIGGVQVASGYVNRPELTREKFVDNPFGDGKMYRTGDSAVLRPDGVILYRGRLDQQVKVHGFRVEPGEIESALLSHPSVAQAVVTAPEVAGGDRQLVAYTVAAEVDSGIDTRELRSWLREQLPVYMVPAVVMVLDALPLLSNGKLDRRTLPAPDGTAATATHTEPDTPEEHVLHEIWRSVLGAGELGVEESFFAVGGDSMQAIRVRTALERRGWSFDITDLFQEPTIRELAGRLRPLDRDAAPAAVQEPFALLGPADRALVPDGIEDAYPLSAMQAGMLFHAAFSEDSSVYRVVTSVRVNAALDLAALRDAVRDTARRHPSLRCSFDLTRYSQPLQLVHTDVEIPVLLGDDLGDLTEPARNRAIADWVEQAKFTRFDTSVAPLLRFVVHPCDRDRFQLTAVEHHVVLDGWSDMRMLEEIVRRYCAHLAGRELDLPEIGSTYRDFVVAERAATADVASRSYWAELLRDVEPTPLVHTTPAQSPVSRHRRYDVAVPSELSGGLRAVAKEAGLPLKSLLTAAHLAVLRRVSGGDEVVTGVVVNGRLEAPDADTTVGVFLNTLPLRLDISATTLVDAARQVFAHERESLPHRRYPIAQIQQDLGESLRLDSYVNFMDFHFPDDAPMTVTLGVAETNYPLAVNFLVDPEHGGLQLWLDCDIAVLPEEFCDRLTGYYERALAAAAYRPRTPVAELALLGPAELDLLDEWTATTVPYDGTATVHGLIEIRVDDDPSARAVVHRDDEITYGELDSRANRLANHLLGLGVRRGDLVGVSVRRGGDLVMALLAVLKAGAAYVPMDPSFPQVRLTDIAADAGIGVLVRGPGAPDGLTARQVVDLRADAAAIAARTDDRPRIDSGGDDLAYVIYTSGSTGKPKGTAIRHRNVVNFFTGMDDRVGCTSDDVVLALTSVSFDISVLEILWPLTHGAKVVVAGERIVDNLVRQSESPDRALGFSLFFFAAAAGASLREGYQLVLDAAKFADTHGFEAVWTPERHFNAFGGLYPNPSVMSAALATVTERIGLRCGSVVAPLHDSVRIAEEWALVDNLSNGRVGLAFAAGWNSNDFILRPDNFPVRKVRMAEQLEEFRTLWRGGTLRRTGGSGETVDVRIFPAPVQAEPPVWLTSVGTVETFQKAGAAGANLLTHLLGQAPAELAEKIKAYRLARQEAGYDGPGQVTLMVHTFMSDDTEEAKRKARGPFRDYLLSSTELWRTMFATTGRDFPELNVEEQLEAIVDLAIDRYFESSGLFGSPDTCAELIRTVAEAGVDEVACLIDFGIDPAEVMDSLTWVDRLRDAHEIEIAESRYPFAELCERHRVTLVQGTPSLFSVVAAEPLALESMRDLRALLIGGEAFPSGLARRLVEALPQVRILNMYGPTETTVWSTVYALDRVRDAEADNISIGEPIANTEIRVMDRSGRPVPIGTPGELWIGGDGVAAGYIGRPELTADRFVADGSGRPFYRTGDRVRWRADGRLHFLGRVDRQVKIRGHRVEPDEIESVLSRHPMLNEVAVAVADGAHGAELVAYVSPAETVADSSAWDAHVRRWGEVWQSVYSGDEAERSTSEFAGWLSSFTGDPIPDEQMREWLAHTVARIRALRPSRVADIGVGVGLILRSLVADVEQYHGVDISAAAVESAAVCLGAGRALPEHVVLVESGPEYLAGLEPDSLDTVVINSVAQYFPGADYLRTVLTDAVRAVRPGGAVFVGDIRSVEMLPEFHAAVQLHRAAAHQTVDEVRSAIARRREDESELCLSPVFFAELATSLDGIGEARCEIKRGRSDNEMTTFRFDVTLSVGPAPAEPTPRVLAWQSLGGDLAALRRRLDEDPKGLRVSGIPNRRLTRAGAVVGILDRIDGRATAWDVERELWDADADGIHPEDVHDLAAELGRPVRLLVAQDGRLDRFDAAFGSRPGDATDSEDIA
ncbi:amino acid adenylation domain-containing protein [Nocardia sp. NPDC051570]|uniref:amino acid adenylation domain-containing protein n=1 Tax=Nocardia sp. NPDC051570 TaxID=3364324 RepID=UPI0037BBA8D9